MNNLTYFLMKKTNAFTKNSELTSVLNTHLQGKINFTCYDSLCVVL